MVRIFKGGPDALSAIAGEMLNLELNHTIFENGKLVGKNKIRPYPKIRSDNCTIIPRLTVGWIDVISGDSIENFRTQLLTEIEKKEKEVPKSFRQNQVVLNVGIDSFCEVKVTSLLNSTSVQPLAGLNKRRLLTSTATIERAKETSQYIWIIQAYNFSDQEDNFMPNLSTIVYDALDVFKYKHDSFYLKPLDVGKLRCMSFASHLKTNQDMDLNMHMRGCCLGRHVGGTNKKQYIADAFYEILTGKDPEKFHTSTLANVYEVSWDDAMSVVEIENIDKCQSCGYMLHNDVYILLNGYTDTLKARSKNESEEPDVKKPDARKITPKQPLLICPHCFPQTNNTSPDTVPYWVLKTTHPRDVSDLFPHIKDKFTRRFLMAVNNGTIQKCELPNRNQHDVSVKYKKSTYILCASLNNYITRNPTADNQKNHVYLFV